MPDQMKNAMIARAQAGNASAIGALYEHYQESVFRYLYYRVGDQQAAEDLTGEVFLRVIKALPRYRRDSVPFQAWIFRIARNLTIDHYRKMSVRNHVKLEENLVSTEEDPEGQTERHLTSERLYEALQSLTDDQRDVIVMRFVAEMSIDQVARALDKSESAVKALQRRGLQALRRVLAKRKVSYV